jgi:mannitol/fructose-specific phosphotransferase system IIA component (Ntr-type)
VPLRRRLWGEVSIAERLVTEGTGITLVVLDTKTISHERETADVIHSTGGASRGPAEGEIEGKTSMRLSDGPVLIWDAPLENEQAVKFLVDACCQGRTKTFKEHAWEALTAREQQGETFGGDDVLIPHARISGLQKPLVAIGIGKAGIHDSNVDRSVKIIFLLLSPTESPEKHLEMLALLSRMAQSDQWREKALAAKSYRDVRSAIGDWQRLHLDE